MTLGLLPSILCVCIIVVDVLVISTISAAFGGAVLVTGAIAEDHVPVTLPSVQRCSINVTDTSIMLLPDVSRHIDRCFMLPE